MKKTLVFDMDGTIANFYGVEGWLKDLRAYSVRPYVEAKPIYDVDTLNTILEILKALGWRIVVTSWLSKESTADFDAEIRRAKREWLTRYNFPADEIHLVKYGTRKANCTRKLGGYQILIDDNEEVRNSWTLGRTIDANRNIISQLVDLICQESL